MFRKNLVVASIALVMSMPALAEEEAECLQDCGGKWSSSLELGYVSVSGNTETNSFNGRFAVSYEIDKWRHAGFIATQTSSSEDAAGVKTEAEKYTAQAKSDYKYTDNAYAFGVIDYDNTRDSGFDYQASYAIGVGYRFIESDEHVLDGEFGFGVRESKIEATGQSNSESIARLAGSYLWNISKTAKFEQKLSTEIGEDNTISKSYSGISANIKEDLALKFSYTAKHQSDVPAGNEKLETITAVTVVYNF